MGGAWFQEEFGAPEAITEERLLARATEAVQRHLGVTAAPSWNRVALQRVQQDLNVYSKFMLHHYFIHFLNG